MFELNRAEITDDVTIDSEISEDDDGILVQVVLDYLAGKENVAIKHTLEVELARHRTANISIKDRYKRIKRRTLKEKYKYDDCAKVIMDALSVPEEKQSEYLRARNLYVLLKKLQPKHRHLAHLIHMIDETKRPRSWAGPFFFAAVAIAGFATLLSFKRNYLAQVTYFAQKGMVKFLIALQHTIKLAKNTPLLGLLSNGIPLLWAWRQAFADGLGLDHDKSSVLFMRTVEYVFPMIACLLCFFAGGVMTIPALYLFIVGSAIDVIGGFCSFVKHEIEQWTDPLPTGDTYYACTSRARAETLRNRDIRVLGINFAATLLITASVVVWCLFPISWVITVSCVVFGWLVGMSKGFATDHINHGYADILQRSLSDITKKYPADKKGLPQRSIRPSIEDEASREQIRGLTEEFRGLTEQIRGLRGEIQGLRECSYGANKSHGVRFFPSPEKSLEQDHSKDSPAQDDSNVSPYLLKEASLT